MKRIFFESADFSQVRSFTDGILLCNQHRAYYQWLYMETEYVQQGGGIFWSAESQILPVDDDIFRKIANPPDSFASDLKEGIANWVALSIKSREKNLEKLKVLNKEYFESLTCFT